MFVRMHAVVSPMKLCGSVCAFFYNKLAIEEVLMVPLKNREKKIYFDD